HGGGGNILPLPGLQGVGCFGNLDGEILRADRARRQEFLSPAGVPVARVSPGFTLWAAQWSREDGERSRGQARRAAGMGPDGGGLFARIPSTRIRDQLELDRLGAGGRDPARPRREGRDYTAQGYPAHA